MSSISTCVRGTENKPFSVGTWSTWGSMGTSRGFGMTEMSYSILEGRLMEVRSRGGGGASSGGKRAGSSGPITTIGL